MFCKGCGKQIAQTARFCDGCGTNLSGGTATAVSPSGAAAAPAPLPLSRHVADEVKARSRDAWHGLRVFAKSPVGGLPESFSLFEERRALQVGIVFAIAYEICVFLGIYIAGSKTPMLGASLPVGDLTAAQALKLVVVGLVPFGSLVGASAIARAVFRGNGNLAGDVYTAGAALIPVGASVLVASFLGPANFEVIAVLAVFALTYFILMLYAGCSRIACMSEAGAAPAVPIMLLVSAWLTKIVVLALW